MINLNSAASWFHSDELEEMDGSQTVVPRQSELMNIQAVTQLEKDTILVCYDSEYRAPTRPLKPNISTNGHPEVKMSIIVH